MSDLQQPCIITIDGPAGGGKSTVAKLLAVRLTERTGIRYEYLDTGSMYRAVSLLGSRSGVDWNVPLQLELLAKNAVIDVKDSRTYLNGKDVTADVRLPEITEKTRYSADNPFIRSLMVTRQQEIARHYRNEGRGLVTEGRDQGTVVFPDAECKFYLTATPEERTHRRLNELKERGIGGNFDEILHQITERDRRDSERPTAPLREPENAHRIVSDGMPIDTVVETMLRFVSVSPKTASSSKTNNQ